MVDEAQLEFPNVGVDETVGERPADPFSTRTWRLPKYECVRTEKTNKIDKPQKKVVRSGCGLP
jgi:hypothetical protein